MYVAKTKALTSCAGDLRLCFRLCKNQVFSWYLPSTFPKRFFTVRIGFKSLISAMEPARSPDISKV